MSGSRTITEDIDKSEFYELVSDVKDDIVNLDDKHAVKSGGPHDELGRHKPDSKTNVGINRLISKTSTPAVNDEIDIKYEEYGSEYDSTLAEEDDLDLEARLPSPNLNPGSINSAEKDFSRFYLDLLQCERDCVTCQDYIRKLSEHVRATHTAGQPSRDPLHIDPSDMDQSSAIETQCDVEPNVQRVDCSEDSDWNFESELESNSMVDPDCNASTNLTRKSKSGQKLSKYNTRSHSSRKDEKKPRTKTKINNEKKFYKCEECGTGFERKKYLTLHMMIHTAERPFKCEECDESFTWMSKLITHKKSHTGELPFKCEVCGTSFNKKYNMIRHMRSHTLERPFKCEECGRTFTSKRDLTGHSRTHTGERPFKCKECGKTFGTTGYLSAHMVCHTPDRPFKCETCGKDFKRRVDLKSHLKSHTVE